MRETHLVPCNKCGHLEERINRYSKVTCFECRIKAKREWHKRKAVVNISNIDSDGLKVE